jgi:outer membrane immunogenic protein
MKTLSLFCAAAMLALPVAAQAQDADESPFSGAHVGVEVTRDGNKVRQDGSPATVNSAERNGYGFRGHLGYDLSLGNVVVVGVEAGIGKGGRTVSKPSLLPGGTYKVDPGLTYDATARLGFTPTSNVMIYGRGGYRWLKTDQSIAGQATGNRNFKLTEKGFTYGGGLEVAVTNGLSLRAEFDRTEYSKNFKQNKISVGASIRF